MGRKADEVEEAEDLEFQTQWLRIRIGPGEVRWCCGTAVMLGACGVVAYGCYLRPDQIPQILGGSAIFTVVAFPAGVLGYCFGHDMGAW
jgi:hypothetical protein